MNSWTCLYESKRAISTPTAIALLGSHLVVAGASDDVCVCLCVSVCVAVLSRVYLPIV